MPGDYLFLNGRGGMLPFAIISPIRIDADGDGRYAPPTPSLKGIPDLPPRPLGPDGQSFECGDTLLR